MRKRSHIEIQSPFGMWCIQPLTAESTGTFGLYRLWEWSVSDPAAFMLSDDMRRWLKRASGAAYNACSIPAWALDARAGKSQAQALANLDRVRLAILEDAGTGPDTEPHAWHESAWLALARQKLRGGNGGGAGGDGVPPRTA
jgi:hypothetical protein